MIGEYPTVGCLILLDRAYFTSAENVIQSLQSSLPISVQPDPHNTVLAGEAQIGGSQHEIIVLAQEVGDVTAIHIEFDEHEIIQVSRTTEQSFEQLFMPYVQAAKGLPGVLAIGIGFELSPPTDFLAETVQDAGIAVLFEQDKEHKSWSRRQTMPLVGHSY